MSFGDITKPQGAPSACPKCGHNKKDKNILPDGSLHYCCKKCHTGWVKNAR